MLGMRKGKAPAKSRTRSTTVTFTAEDLAALSRLTEVGQAMLQVRYPVVAKIKAAMTRLGVSTKGA